MISMCYKWCKKYIASKRGQLWPYGLFFWDEAI